MRFQRVCLQCKTRSPPLPKCSFLAQNAFVVRDTRVCLQWLVAGPISSLAINAFVCHVIPYSVVKRVVFESWFRNSPKRTETRGKSFWKTSFRVGMEMKKVQKQGRDEKASRTLLHYGTMSGPSLASSAMHLHP